MGLGGARWVRDVDCGGPVNGVWFGTYPVKVNTDHPLSTGLSDFEVETRHTRFATATTIATCC